MRVLYYAPDDSAQHWVPELQAALQAAGLPAQVQAWERGMPTADFCVVWKPPQAMLDEQHSAKAYFVTGAGVDSLLTLRFPPRLPVIRLDDAGMAVQMAEYVTQAVVRYFRGLDSAEATMRAGQWQLPPVRSRADFAVGVLGLGVLGARVAQALATFEFPVLGWSRSPKQVGGVRTFHGIAQLPAFLQQVQCVVCLLPLTPETDGLLNAERLAHMPRGSYLINVARGAHVVDADLLAALDSGQLAGATLDVFRTEPLPPEHAFWGHPRLTLTPHTSARTLRSESIAQIVHKMQAVLHGQAVVGVVDPNKGY
ncbi:glyoxylate/hydroxypyruvate reductase A [Curvibacter sp. CHRR-16]|uniref:2-hydroxyacid dehydrogenase n=1 Tax=Curvibacter sp. CHRR-16 TaxID=2835872 RepID=UPI001BD9A93B|nr:glyoxylate/hydroxypyruvate reductase A [Curvibacter sp. CHRR-16]MBT0569934.1 glyoxylate/hydroxypyruvate reductase A [Curvibacter sp. CHRR-16]